MILNFKAIIFVFLKIDFYRDILNIGFIKIYAPPWWKLFL